MPHYFVGKGLDGVSPGSIVALTKKTPPHVCILPDNSFLFEVKITVNVRDEQACEAHLDEYRRQPFRSELLVYAEEIDVHHAHFLPLDLSQGGYSRDERDQLLCGLHSDGHMPVLGVAWGMKGPLQKLFRVVEPAEKVASDIRDTSNHF